MPKNTTATFKDKGLSLFSAATAAKTSELVGLKQVRANAYDMVINGVEAQRFDVENSIVQTQQMQPCYGNTGN